MQVDLTGNEWDAILSALHRAADAVIDIDDVDNYEPEDLDGIDQTAAEYVALHNKLAAQVGGEQLPPRLVTRPDTDEYYGDIQDCPDCRHRLYLHRRQASGAYRCTSSGCGCERA